MNILRIILSAGCSLFFGLILSEVTVFDFTGSVAAASFSMIIVAVISYPGFYRIFKNVPTIKKLLSSAVSYSKDVSEGMKIAPEFYAVAEQEILDNEVDKGLWAKALVNAKGNEDLRKVKYIKLRAKQLQKES